MGTYGSGNLDSDYASDVLYGRAESLLREILLRAQRKSSREYDESDYVVLFVELEILFELDAAGLMRTRTFPTAAAVRTLALEWLVDFDANLEEPWPERHAKIAESFERFAHICEAHEGSSPLPSPPAPAKPTPARSTGVSKTASKTKVASKTKPKTKTKAKSKPTKRR